MYICGRYEYFKVREGKERFGMWNFDGGYGGGVMRSGLVRYEVDGKVSVVHRLSYIVGLVL